MAIHHNRGYSAGRVGRTNRVRGALRGNATECLQLERVAQGVAVDVREAYDRNVRGYNARTAPILAVQKAKLQ